MRHLTIENYNEPEWVLVYQPHTKLITSVSIARKHGISKGIYQVIYRVISDKFFHMRYNDGGIRVTESPSKQIIDVIAGTLSYADRYEIFEVNENELDKIIMDFF